MKYTDEQRVDKILKYCERLMEYIKEMQIDEDQLLTDYKIQWAVTTPLYNIGENAYSLSKEFKSKHSDIPWNMIASLRHRLVHDYEGTNWSIISDVVFEEIPKLIDQLQLLLS